MAVRLLAHATISRNTTPRVRLLLFRPIGTSPTERASSTWRVCVCVDAEVGGICGTGQFVARTTRSAVVVAVIRLVLKILKHCFMQRTPLCVKCQCHLLKHPNTGHNYRDDARSFDGAYISSMQIAPARCVCTRASAANRQDLRTRTNATPRHGSISAAQLLPPFTRAH